ncbi:uncharacterized protein DUF1240 [Buttiauxella sp. JUb87]|uniref:DUF1240 domain-containing protein n=1 Tax=Buttiauxella sp. JUb87 TaxID=2485129 RepID=UPI00105C3ED7|nr:DUF1240 domain-containing protein [Buttiauxella sp. JUb87]TDN50643.1 uncharacterized protein DUF1240 [Buttiauxella sp. JUb87]
MDIVKLKGIVGAVFIFSFLTSGVVFFYTIGSETLVGMIKDNDYIYYDWKQIPMLFFIPVMVLLDCLIICLLLPCRKKVVAITNKLMIPVTVYSIVALVFGFLLSIVISIYPLGTNYYKCDSTSIVSSGSYYAKSKEICKQRAYSPAQESKVDSIK